MKSMKFLLLCPLLTNTSISLSHTLGIHLCRNSSSKEAAFAQTRTKSYVNIYNRHTSDTYNQPSNAGIPGTAVAMDSILQSLIR